MYFNISLIILRFYISKKTFTNYLTKREELFQLFCIRLCAYNCNSFKTINELWCV